MEPDHPEPTSLAAHLAGDVDFWDPSTPGDQHTLVDLVNRVLDRGVVIAGDVTISVAGVDLVYLGLTAMLTSISTARQALGRSGGPESPEG